MTMYKGAFLAASMGAAVLASTPALAQRGPWGNRWEDRGYPGMIARAPQANRYRDPREGRVEVSRFVVPGPAADQLGHGAVAVESEAGEGPWIEPARRAAYEAAVVDALVGVGYDTRNAADAGAQVVSLRIARQVLAPAEEKRSPVSGSAAVTVGNRGSAYGLAIDVDMTKPRPALVSTRLDARIMDKAGTTVLWEGYATIATREGDDDWGDGRIASALATALFDKFPKADTVVPAGA